MELLHGKTALITGAARGQGRAHALTLARAGADIIAIDIARNLSSVPYDLGTEDELLQTAASVQAVGRRVLAVQADVRHQDELDGAVARGIAEFGRIDICVANAGIYSLGPFWELSEEQWSQVMDVDLAGVWRTAKAVAPNMIEQRSGAMVFTGSVQSLKAGNETAHYTAAKHGIIGLMRSIAFELAPYGVRCNVVCPGAVDTGMINWQGMYDRFAGHRGGGREDLVMAGQRYHPLAPQAVLQPESIAEAVLWLVSDLANRVTGAILPVDAGQLIR
jgi:SDR family mycofactocin-dependent oxidoreductase